MPSAVQGKSHQVMSWQQSNAGRCREHEAQRSREHEALRTLGCNGTQPRAAAEQHRQQKGQRRWWVMG